MSQSNQPPAKPDLEQYTRSLSYVAVGGEVGCLTLIIIILALVAGIGLDRLLNTKPLFTIGLVLGSIPLTLMLTVWVALRSVKNLSKPSKSIMDSKPNMEENQRE
jgi:hypothetical protein